MPPVEHVVTVIHVIHVNVVGFVPVCRPVLRPWINEAEPITTVLKAWKPANHSEGQAVDAECVLPAVVAAEVFVWNAEAAVAAALLPSAVLGLPATRAMPLPGAPLFALLCWCGPPLGLLPVLALPLLLGVLGLLLSILTLLLLLSMLLLLPILPLLLLLLSMLLLLPILPLLLLLLGMLLLLPVLPLLLLGMLLPAVLVLRLSLGVLLLLLGLGLLLLALLVSLVFALLLMLRVCRNCGPHNQEQKCGADDSDSLHFSCLPSVLRVIR
jgi:hypothetical protein